MEVKALAKFICPSDTSGKEEETKVLIPTGATNSRTIGEISNRAIGGIKVSLKANGDRIKGNRIGTKISKDLTGVKIKAQVSPKVHGETNNRTNRVLGVSKTSS